MALNPEQEAIFDDITIMKKGSCLLKGYAGTGKAQPLDSNVLTPNGWKLMGDIKKGDKVTTPDGKTANVIGVYPQGKKDIFKVTFKDGRTAECCKEHLWKVYDYTWKEKWRVLSLEDIMNRKKSLRNLKIQLVDTLDIKNEKNDLPIDPYFMGYMLGNGCFRIKTKFVFSTNDNFIIEYLSSIIDDKYYIKKINGYNYDYTIKPKIKIKSNSENLYLNIFRDLGLYLKYSYEKFIPDIFLNSSYNDRIKLIQGLIDSDGYVDKNGNISYTTSSYKLAENVQYLIRSIGGIAKITTKIPTYTYKSIKRTGRKSYNVNIRFVKSSNLTMLPRKKDRTNDNNQYSNNLFLEITKIEYSRNTEAQCIMIDSEDHLYITDNFVVTHNTYLAKEIINYFLGIHKTVTCLAPTHQAKLQLKSNIEDHKNLNFTTVASFLNVKLTKNKITGKREFTDGNIDKSKATDIIIIDECSMLTEKQVRSLLALKNKSLLIFIGDFNQLPPVNAKNGEVYFNNMKIFELKTQQRNSGEILTLCNTLRTKVVYPSQSSETIGVFKNKDDLFEGLISCIEMDQDPLKTSYLGYTNFAVKEMRNKIHRRLFNDDEFHIGQFLRLETPTTTGTIGEVYVIIEIEKQKILLFGDIEFNGYKVNVLNLLTNITESFSCLNYLDQDDVENCLEELYKEAEKRYDKFVKEKDKEQKKLLKLDWEETLKIIATVEDVVFVSSPYALTIHKSQGRTIDNVFLDVPDIRKYGGNIKKSLLYVGASRTKEMLITIK